MKVSKIEYPTVLSKIADIDNNNIDVFIELEDGTRITVVVSTPDNLRSYMDKENLNFISATQPDIIVKSLTEDNIKQAIENYAEGDAFWLKLLFVASVDREFIDMDRINQCLNKIKKENHELFDA
ncbi:hypothetical protein [Paenibacillus monticola]|uniref:Uncharacterized protein n=1 Tax=Paenibacillus monticola TaxID=2666075 RepID=A0A7X2L1K7_9BACL|nr:hypothetical protein [Paenibacillus monticola]MRN53484.1 hypothetical protein [Paenibacillus monticola]